MFNTSITLLNNLLAQKFGVGINIFYIVCFYNPKTFVSLLSIHMKSTIINMYETLISTVHIMCIVKRVIDTLLFHTYNYKCVL